MGSKRERFGVHAAFRPKHLVGVNVTSVDMVHIKSFSVSQRSSSSARRSCEKWYPGVLDIGAPSAYDG